LLIASALADLALGGIVNLDAWRVLAIGATGAVVLGRASALRPPSFVSLLCSARSGSGRAAVFALLQFRSDPEPRCMTFGLAGW